MVSRGKGSKIELQDCTVEDNAGNGVGMDEGGQAVMVNTKISGRYCLFACVVCVNSCVCM